MFSDVSQAMVRCLGSPIFRLGRVAVPSCLAAFSSNARPIGGDRPSLHIGLFVPNLSLLPPLPPRLPESGAVGVSPARRRLDGRRRDFVITKGALCEEKK